MVTRAVEEVASALRTLRIDVPGVRWLSEEDGAALRGLIEACYGDTYSYQRMYEGGYVEGLWAAGALLSLGEFAEDGALIGHTGFWTKDPRAGYVESGLSLVSPERREGVRVDYPRAWRPLLERLGERVAYVHQNTTTLHPMAQFYALKHMRARPTGFVLGYTRGERVRGLHEGGGWMHALVMTTALRAEGVAAALPGSAWQGWLAEMAAAAGVPTCADEGEAVGPLAVDVIEDNAALGLLRLGLRGGPEGLDAALAGVTARVLVAHLPATGGVSALFEALVRRGFVPTGLRPQGARAHEWTLQRLSGVEEGLLGSLGEVRLATEALSALWEGWRGCAGL